MAIAFDAAGLSEESPGDGVITVPHTCTGSNRFLRVGVSAWDGTTNLDCSSVTYASVAMTRIAAHVDSATGQNFIFYYGLVAPTTTNNDIVVTMNHSSSVYLTVGHASYTGVDQTTPAGTPVLATGSSASVSLVVSSASGQLVTDAIYAETPVVHVSQTQRWNGGSQNGAGSDEAGAASVTMSWTCVNNPWVSIGVPLYPVGGAPTGDLSTRIVDPEEIMGGIFKISGG